MVFDDIIVGSGLVALATALGLSPDRRVMVIAGPKTGRMAFYDQTRNVPSAFFGFGGLGNYWHGVIPTAFRGGIAHGTERDVSALFGYFYPNTEIAGRLGAPWLFIPRRPIRPKLEWSRLRRDRGDRLEMVFEDGIHFELGDNKVLLRTATSTILGKRLWIAAGTLATPDLLERSLGRSGRRASVSDHVICYAGQLDRAKNEHLPPPNPQRVSDGYWISTFLTDASDALLTVKPARFDNRILDKGFEQRAAFGLKTSSAISKIAAAGSLGLISEAIFNRFGMFADSSMLSVYSQILVRDAYDFQHDDGTLRLNTRNVLKAISDVVIPWRELIPTQRPERFLKGIHLHHSIDIEELDHVLKSNPHARIVDSSPLEKVGPEHHSFYVMARAYGAAREV